MIICYVAYSILYQRPPIKAKANIIITFSDHSWSTHLKKVDGADCVPQIQRLGDEARRESLLLGIEREAISWLCVRGGEVEKEYRLGQTPYYTN